MSERAPWWIVRVRSLCYDQGREDDSELGDSVGEEGGGMAHVSRESKVENLVRALKKLGIRRNSMNA